MNWGALALVLTLWSAGPVAAGEAGPSYLVADQGAGRVIAVGANGDATPLPSDEPAQLVAPRGIALSPDGRSLAVVDAGSGDGDGAILVITAEGAVSTLYSGLTFPEDVAWLDDESLVWTSSVGGEIRRGDLDGSEPEVLADVGASAIGITVFEQGSRDQLLVTTWQGTAFVVDPSSGDAFPSGGTLEGGGHPAAGPDTLCVPEFEADRVRCMSIGGSERELEIDDPVAAAFDGEDLVVTSPAGVTVFGPDGTDPIATIGGLVNAAGVAPLGPFAGLWDPQGQAADTTTTSSTSAPPVAGEATTTTTAATRPVTTEAPATSVDTGLGGGLIAVFVAVAALGGLLLGLLLGRRRLPAVPAPLPLPVRRAVAAAGDCDEEEFWKAFWVAEDHLFELQRRLEWAEEVGEDPEPIRRELDAATEALEKARRRLLDECPRPEERYVDFGGESVDPIPEPCRALAELEQEIERIVAEGGRPDPALVETARRLSEECEEAKRPKPRVTGTASVGEREERYFIHVYVDKAFPVSHVAVGLTGPDYDKVWSTGARDTEKNTDADRPDTIRKAFFEPGEMVDVDGTEVEFGTQEWYRLESERIGSVLIIQTMEISRDEFEEARRRLVGWLFTQPDEWFGRQGWIYAPMYTDLWGSLMNVTGMGGVLGPYDGGHQDREDWFPIPSTAAMCPAVWLAVRSIFTDSTSWGVSWAGGITVARDVEKIVEEREEAGLPAEE